MPGGGPTQSQNQSQSSQTSSTTSPWAPAVPLLSGILDKLGGIDTGVTGDQSIGSQVLLGGAQAQPNMGPQAAGTINSLFGSSTLPSQGLLTTSMGNLTKDYGNFKDAYGGYAGQVGGIQGMLSNYMDPGYTNPMTNPAIQGWLDTLKSDTTNSVNGQFAAAGRTWSPGHAMALGRGITAAEAPVLANQYNQNVQAQQNAGQLSGNLATNLFGGANSLFGGANSVFGAGNTTAQGLNSLRQTELNNGANAVALSSALPGLYTGPGSSMLSAANTAFGLPMSNIAQLLGLATPVAGMGSSSTGTSMGTGTGTASVDSPFGIQQALGAGVAGAGLLAKLAPMFAMSDAELKDDIKRVGILDDGQPVFAYHYKQDPNKKVHIGLLAQLVEEYAPEAVADFDGFKAVDYGKATANAAAMAA